MHSFSSFQQLMIVTVPQHKFPNCAKFTGFAALMFADSLKELRPLASIQPIIRAKLEHR